MSEILVQVDRVSKRYCRGLRRSLWYGVCDLARELTGSAASAPHLRRDEFWALRDVSFELKRGECLGLVGPNGAGKSTLLKLLGGLIKPDSGSLRLRGRVGALIELGAGFHPLLSGRENIYINGSILGMTTRQIDRRLDEIIDFAEIGDAIDSPVRTYSSGMRARLGFAIAAHLEPDILLIDEVLAVGDVRFRMKCYDRLLRARRDGVAMAVVSHNLVDIQRTSNRMLLLSQGQPYFLGDVAPGLIAYDRLLLTRPSNSVPTGPIRSLRIDCSNDRDPAAQIFSGDDVRMELALELDSPPVDVRFILHIESAIGVRVGSFPVIAPGNRLIRISTTTWQGHFVISRIPLAMGHYSLAACVYGEHFTEHYATYLGAGSLEIAGPTPDPFGFACFGLVHLRISPCQSENTSANSAVRMEVL